MNALDGRIVDYAPYGEHIDLTCINHPELRWNTKNIMRIGARTIFYALGQKNPPPECRCSADCLRPLTLDEALGI